MFSRRIAIFSLATFLVWGLCFLSSPHFARADLTADAVQRREDALKAELAALTAEIAEKQALLDAKHGESASLQRDVALLNGKIQKAKLSIKASDIILQQLNNDIGIKSETISALEERIAKNKASLADLIRKTNQTENNSLVEMILNDQTISDFVSDINDFDTIKSSLRDLYFEISDQKQTTETEKQSLEEKSQAEADAKALLEAQKRQVELTEKQKKDLLTVTKSQEKNYALAVAARQKRAAEIRSALFSLRDTSAIPFGTALEYATFISGKTGIRPAFLLAILTQESNLGQNVGSCFLTDTTTGNGIGANTRTPQSRVMHPTRDVPVFLGITKSLGLDFATTRVSCWQPIYSKGSPIGWGGAMGPAQFIPSTWKLFVNRIAAVTGNALPNPWSPKDAFTASALYLTDLGAKNGSYTGEMNAACKYYSGSGCITSYAKSYGAQVMAKAASIQENMIDPLQNL
ncbi:MAG: lytic murein transglycosylase [Candidatus Pacebacteria bacterium]|nr:lytic murein transglycosylase [Candidatus Paceibacterota bacterium]MDD5356602.1 lytic murein transglycosylase [Candidatus Paceibacterota bacterium]